MINQETFLGWTKMTSHNFGDGDDVENVHEYPMDDSDDDEEDEDGK